MEKQTGLYPKDPLAWDPSKTREDNEKREATEPGIPRSTAFDIEDSQSGGDNTDVNAELASADTYPDWYKPALDAMGSGTVSAEINQPTDIEPAPEDASPDSIVCKTTYFDCVHAFTFNDYRDLAAHKGKKDEDHWEVVSSHRVANIMWNNDDREMNSMSKHVPSMFATTRIGQTTARKPREISWITHRVSSPSAE
jgi:hypothetical protein